MLKASNRDGIEEMKHKRDRLMGGGLEVSYYDFLLFHSINLQPDILIVHGYGMNVMILY